MKKLLFSSVVLLLFSFSIILFQVSCQKEATADSNGISTTQLNKIIFEKITFPIIEIWMCNYDGTGAAKLNIILPSGVSFSEGYNPVMSPDGKKIFFTAGTGSQTPGDLYSCNSDGTGVTKIVDRGTGRINLGGAY